MPQDYYIQPDAPDPVLSEEMALRLARRHAPSARAVRAVDESGGEARSYAIDDTLILKTQRPPRLRPRTSLKKEVRFLQQLDGVAGVSVPRVLGYDHPEPGIEYTLLTRMPGVALRRANPTGEPRRQALKDLGRMLWRIHHLPQAPLRDSGLFFGDQSPVDVYWRMGGLFDETGELIRRDGKPWTFRLPPEVVGRAMMRSLPQVRTITALHSNPGPEHTFVDPASGQLSGLIDFGDAYFSHPANDLRRYRDPADRRAILDGYLEAGPVDAEFLAVWRVACSLADLVAIAYSPELQPAATLELEQFLEEVEQQKDALAPPVDPP